MKYSLRTLLIAAILGPPLLAGAFVYFGFMADILGILTLLGWPVIAILAPLVSIPLTLFGWALVRLGHPDGQKVNSLSTRQLAFDFVLFALIVLVVIPSIVAAILAFPLSLTS